MTLEREHDPRGEEPQPRSDGSRLAAVSNEMVRIYKDKYGRGPTRTRAGWAGDDTLVVVLEDTLTAAEQTLQSMGEYDRLRELRLHIQYFGVDDFNGAVERVFGRKVRSFVSGIDARTGVAAEVFVLEPEE